VAGVDGDHLAVGKVMNKIGDLLVRHRAGRAARDDERGDLDRRNHVSPGWSEVVDLWAYLLDHLPVERQDSIGFGGRVGRPRLEQPDILEYEAPYLIRTSSGDQARHQPTEGMAHEVD